MNLSRFLAHATKPCLSQASRSAIVTRKNFPCCYSTLLHRLTIPMPVRLISPTARYQLFATTTTENNDEPEIVLYQRKTNPSLTLMRSGFFCSAFHTTYWIWYTTDFIPTVNNAALTNVHVDPAVGVAGICFAIALQTAFIIYPKRLVHKLSYRPRSQKVVVYTHRLPFIRPNLFPTASFPVGTHNERLKTATKASASTDTSDDMKRKEDAATKIKYFKLNPSSPEAVQIVSDFKGDVTRYRGHLQVGQSWPRYALDIRSAQDVPEPELLLEALLRPEYFGLPQQHQDDETLDNRNENYGKKWGRQWGRRVPTPSRNRQKTKRPGKLYQRK